MTMRNAAALPTAVPPDRAPARTVAEPDPPPRRRAKDDRRVAWLFLLPVLVGFAVFYLYPTARGIWYSVTDYSLLNTPSFVGADNYTELVADTKFWDSLKVTVYYVVLNIGSQTLLALVVAALMHRLTRSTVLRATMLLPWLVPKRDGGPDLDVAARRQPGLRQPPARPGRHRLARLPQLADLGHALGRASSTRGPTPGTPRCCSTPACCRSRSTCTRARALDGAGELRMFGRITLPLLRPILALVLVVSLIGSFQIFDTVAVATKGGGPAGATRVIYYFIYEQAFRYFHMGYAAAAAMVLVLILGVLTFVQMRLLRASNSDLN
ncbi:hypothetical protein GCM10020218_058020 [Dactylosporangium vinaceum]